MDQRATKTVGAAAGTTVKRVDREIVVTRTFDAPVALVFEAWTKPELFMRWWAPSSVGMALLSCEMDVRTGGKYRLEFAHDASSSLAFHGRYIEVVPNSRIVWTNEESDEGAVSTVTFEEQDGKTLLTFRELYPSKEALVSQMGAEDAMPEQFDQLDELLTQISSSVEKS